MAVSPEPWWVCVGTLAPENGRPYGAIAVCQLCRARDCAAVGACVTIVHTHRSMRRAFATAAELRVSVNGLHPRGYAVVGRRGSWGCQVAQHRGVPVLSWSCVLVGLAARSAALTGGRTGLLRLGLFIPGIARPGGAMVVCHLRLGRACLTVVGGRHRRTLWACVTAVDRRVSVNGLHPRRYAVGVGGRLGTARGLYLVGCHHHLATALQEYVMGLYQCRRSPEGWPIRWYALVDRIGAWGCRESFSDGSPGGAVGCVFGPSRCCGCRASWRGPDRSAVC